MRKGFKQLWYHIVVICYYGVDENDIAQKQTSTVEF